MVQSPWIQVGAASTFVFRYVHDHVPIGKRKYYLFKARFVSACQYRSYAKPRQSVHEKKPTPEPPSSRPALVIGTSGALKPHQAPASPAWGRRSDILPACSNAARIVVSLLPKCAVSSFVPSPSAFLAATSKA
jgi:hypothetical protein